jgi:hypothetical protein
MSLLGSTRVRLKSALVLAVALGLTACSQANNGTRQPGTLPTCPTITGSTMLPLGRDYTAVVPASFGWLPLALMGPGSVDLVQGPSNGGSYPADYVADGESQEAGVVLGPGFGVTVRPDTAGVPGQRLPSQACQPGPGVMSPAGAPTASAVMPDVPRKPAPPVHGSAAYFMPEGASGDEDPGESLTWKAASGNWLTVSLREPGGVAVGRDSSTGEAALEHMAQTLRVGAVPLPLPVQFTGIPSAWRMRIGQIALTQDLSVHPPVFRRLDATVYFGPGLEAWGQLTVLPANPLSHGVLPIPTASTMCKNGPGLTACIDIINMPEVERFVPVSSPARSLMGHLTVLGADPVAWSPKLVAGTVQDGHRSSPGTPPAPVTSSNVPAGRPEPVDLADPVVTHGTHVELRWVHQGGDTGSGVAGYEIYRTGLAPPAAEVLIATVGPNQDSYVDTTALKVTSTGMGLYSYRVITRMEDSVSVSSLSVVAQLSQPAHA